MRLQANLTGIAKRARDIDADTVTHTRRQYCAATQVIDDQIGELLETLDRTGQRDDTIVLYSSDHGEMLGDHGCYQKTMMYEPSLLVPLVISGPGVASGVVSDALVELIDTGATVADLAGLAPMPNVDARSFAPVLRGETDTHRDSQISFLENCGCIRTGTHKYVENVDDIDELYDLRTDPNELTNLIDDQPDTVEAMRDRLRARCGGPWRR